MEAQLSDAYQVNPGPLYRARKPIRDAEYRRFVKRFPCVGCGRTWGIDPMHTGPHGLNQKACDSTVIPGCWTCHPLFDAAPRKFAHDRGLDIPALRAMFQHYYFLRTGKRIIDQETTPNPRQEQAA